MSATFLPAGFRLERLAKHHHRRSFRSSHQDVDEWLITKSFQQQQKHLSATKVLLDHEDTIVGYYTLAIGHVDFSELPHDVVKQLPRRQLPVATLAWFGINLSHQGQGLGRRMLAQALSDCFDAGQTFAFVAVVLDCINENAREFYARFGFEEMPGQPFRMFLSFERLRVIVEGQKP